MFKLSLGSIVITVSLILWMLYSYPIVGFVGWVVGFIGIPLIGMIILGFSVLNEPTRVKLNSR